MTSNNRIPYAVRGGPDVLGAPMLGKRLIVNIVLNVEYWPPDRPMPRTILTPPHGQAHIPDVPNFSWAEYGMRYGLPRLIELIKERNLPASVNLNSSVLVEYVDAAKLLVDAGFELVGHGVDQQSLSSVPDERSIILEAIDKLETFSGRRVRGWLGPGLQETTQTPDILSDCGLDYVCDWVLDERPVWLSATPRPLVVVPYSLELNDSVIYAVERHSSPELLRRVVDTLRSFDEEPESGPMVLSLPVHPHLVGVRHRLPYFQEILDLSWRARTPCL